MMTKFFFCVGRPLAAEINIPPLWPIENTLINCTRLEIEGARPSMIARQDGEIIFGLGRP